MKTVLIKALLLFVVVLACSSLSSGQVSGDTNKCSPRVGKVLAVQDGTIAVKQAAAVLHFQLNRNTTIKYGKGDQIHVGDDVIVDCRVAETGGMIATNVLVNWVKWGGKITTVSSRTIGIVGVYDSEGPGPEDAPGHITVLIRDDTIFTEGMREDLKPGRFVEVTGSDLGRKRMEASAINIWPLQQK